MSGPGREPIDDARGAATRRRLVAAGARLMAERGVGAAPIREIVRAAGLGNTGALQYYFGSREGLVRAVVADTRERIARRRSALLAAIARARGSGDLRPLVAVMIRPLGELLAGPPAARAGLVVLGRILADPPRGLEDLADAAEDPAAEMVARLVPMTLPRLPRALVAERLRLAVDQATVTLAGRARVEGAEGPRRPGLPPALYTENLIDMAAAAIAAPVSPETAARLEEEG